MSLARWRHFAVLLILLVGIVLSPLRAVATTVPMFIAYDAAVLSSTMAAVGRPVRVRQSVEEAVRGEAWVASEYTYDSALVGYDDARNSLGIGAARGGKGHDDEHELTERRELAEAVICDAPFDRTAAEGVQTLSSSAIRFSQSSVNGLGPITESMAAKGWVGAPIDVVQLESGLTTVDNTRLLAAHLTDTPVQAIVHGAEEALPASMAGRFGNATTWGEAVLNRSAGQNAAYRSLFPNGSWAVGVGP
jgi:hypothetical protein